jgi:hypothetical protein
MTLVGTATETVHSRGSVGLKRAEGLKVDVSIEPSSSPSLSNRRLWDVLVSECYARGYVWGPWWCPDLIHRKLRAILDISLLQSGVERFTHDQTNESTQ